MTQELALIEDIKEENYPVIYGRSGLDHFYEKVKTEVSSEVPDLTTAKGRARIASLAANVSKSKVAVEKPGREYLKQLKDLPKKIEAELRDFADKMDKLRDETRKPLTDWENAEKARVDSHKNKIGHIVSYRDARTDVTVSQMGALIETLEAFCIDSSFEEFEAEAHREKAESLAFLKAARERLIKHEAEQAELARLRAEAEERARKDREEQIEERARKDREEQIEERARKDREEQIAREAAEKAKREAEEAAAREKAAAERRELELKLAAEQAERQRIAAEQAAKDADAARIKAEQDAAELAAKAARDAIERAKQEAEAKAAREAAELAAREKDKAHRARINNEAAASFIEAGFTEEQARKIVVLVASGKVKNIRISY